MRPTSAKAKQNDRFAVVLKITEPQPQFGRIIVADYLPAGFEIDNPRLVSSGETGTLELDRRLAQPPVHSEFRDDRFTRGLQSQQQGSAAVFTVAYVVRAVSPGRYVACRKRMSRTCTGPTVSARTSDGHRRGRRQRNETRRGFIVAVIGGAGHAGRRGRRSDGCGRWARRRARRSAIELPRIGRARPRRAVCCALMRRRRGAGVCRRTVDDVDPRFIRLLLAYEDKRFYGQHHGRRSIGHGAGGNSVGKPKTISCRADRTYQCRSRVLLEPREHRSFGAKLRQVTRAFQLEYALGKRGHS